MIEFVLLSVLCIEMTGFSIRRLMSCKVAILPKENINILFIVEHVFTSTSVDVKIINLVPRAFPSKKGWDEVGKSCFFCCLISGIP